MILFLLCFQASSLEFLEYTWVKESRTVQRFRQDLLAPGGSGGARVIQFFPVLIAGEDTNSSMRFDSAEVGST